jgi:hypothetical protein
VGHVGRFESVEEREVMSCKMFDGGGERGERNDEVQKEGAGRGRS